MKMVMRHELHTVDLWYEVKVWNKVSIPKITRTSRRCILK